MQYLDICVKIIDGADPHVQRDIDYANQVFDQCSLGVRIRKEEVNINPNFVVLESNARADVLPTEDELALFDLIRDTCPAQVIVYYVRQSTYGFDGCAAHPPKMPGVVITDSADRTTLAHELGHILGLCHDNSDHKKLMYGDVNENKYKLTDRERKIINKSGYLSIVRDD